MNELVLTKSKNLTGQKRSPVAIDRAPFIVGIQIFGSSAYESDSNALSKSVNGNSELLVETAV